jgi:cytochrome c oxidase cbb3-type subunit 3
MPQLVRIKESELRQGNLRKTIEFFCAFRAFCGICSVQMRSKIVLGFVVLLSAGFVLGGQRGALPGQRPAPTNFPAQQRTIDSALAARGKTLYEINCRLCHGADLRGGDQGGPNLLRSQITLNDQAGELIYPVIRDGKREAGLPMMAPVLISEDDAKAVTEYIHSILATTQRQGGPPPAPRPSLNVLVGDASAGKEYFDARCSACHSASGDLRSIGEKISDPTQLQNAWLSGTVAGARGGNPAPAGPNAAPNANPAAVTVTDASGLKVQGKLGRIDDFIVVVNFEDGTSRSFRREGDNPKVEVKDPRDAHRNLLPGYTDKDIHNVTAYLVTLK